jgi:TatD DNase family protein
MLIDTHCHLDFEDFAGDRQEVLRRARNAGVQEIITIGIDLATSRRALALAEDNEGVYATVGIHPHDSYRLSPADMEELRAMGRRPQVVGYGEIGLDFYRNYQPRSLQLSCFVEQLGLAKQLGLPVVVHDREAHEDTFQVLKAEKAWEMGVVLHCFSGDWSFARRCLDLGFYLSIAGPVTFSKAPDLQEVARRCPLDQLLLETDAPFLAPVPKRGKRNEPAFLVHTAEKVALLRDLQILELSRRTTANARRLFKLPQTQEEKAYG